MELKYFKNCKNPADADAKYRALRQVLDLYNTDSDQEIKDEIEKEYNLFTASFNVQNQEDSQRPTEYSLDEVIQKIKSMNLKGEVCGKWLWLTDNKAHGYRDDLRKIGFRYSPTKRSWYWRRYEHRSTNQNPIPIEAIREQFGSNAF